MKNIVLKGQHTIQHVMLKSNEIGERGIKLQIDKSKNTERKLGDEVLGKQMQPLDKKRKSSISVKRFVNFHIIIIIIITYIS